MVRYHLHRKSFKSKPTPDDIKKITNYIMKREVVESDMKELSSYLEKGMTVILAEQEDILKDFKARKKLIKRQDLIFLDIDNDTNTNIFYNISDALKDEFIINNASFIYKTFSHDVTETKDRFRIVFQLDKSLVNYRQVESLYNDLFKLFPDGVIDKKCRTTNRLFFGGKDVIEINYNNKLKVDESYLNILVDEYELDEERTKALKQKEEWIKRKPGNTVVVNNDYVRQLSLFDDITNIPTWMLIKEGSYDDEIKRRWSVYSARLRNRASLINYCKSINMFKLLGIKETNSSFKCIIYPDNNPSASIFELDETGIFLYSRVSKTLEYNFRGNFIQVFQKLTGLNFQQALIKISVLMDIQYGLSEKVEDIIQSLDANITVLQSADLLESYPSIYNIFKRYRNQIVMILDILKKNLIEDENGDIRIISQLSYKNLSRMMTLDEDGFRSISRIINLMAVTSWIIKLPEEQIPEKIRKDIINFRDSKKYKYRMNVLEIVSLGDDFIDKLSETTDLMVRSNITASNITYDSVYRIMGEKKADEVFPQNYTKGVSEESLYIENVMFKYINEQIDKNNYVEERQVLSHVGKIVGKEKATRYFKGIKADLLLKYGLIRVRLGKELKKDLNVEDLYTSRQMPFILINENYLK